MDVLGKRDGISHEPPRELFAFRRSFDHQGCSASIIDNSNSHP